MPLKAETFTLCLMTVFSYRAIIPSINEGKHACQHPKSALDCVLGFGGRQPACTLRPCQPPFMNTGRSFGVFCGAGSWPFGLVCCKTPKKPLPGALTLKNRVNTYQIMEIIYNISIKVRYKLRFCCFLHT